jgi:peptidyl-prolyl cis-trans isomerase A (cyclophilin A)
MVSKTRLFLAFILLLIVAASALFLNRLPPGLYAVFHTSQGDFTCKLYPQDAPHTVENFTQLAQGTKEWFDSRIYKVVKRPLYDGTTFHRVVPGVLIQGGDPTGLGKGNPGYRFRDEFSDRLSFDKPGMLAMANAGPNTNGCQFFVTLAPTPAYNKKHSIFGEVIQGFDVVQKIGNVKTLREQPMNNITLDKLEIKRVD